MTTIAALGAGVMASALTFPIAENGHDVRLIGTHLDDAIIDSVQHDGLHPGLGVRLDPRVQAFHFAQAEDAIADADIVLLGVNSFGIDWAGEQLGRLLRPGQHVHVVTKGLRADADGTLRILPDVLKAAVGPVGEQVGWSAVVGPSIAGELAVRVPTCVVFAGTNQATLDELAALWRTDYYHVWTSLDFVGHEVGAATKNVYAFGQGFADGILAANPPTDHPYVMFNYSAALFGQGSVEVHRFIELLGGDPRTADGLGGVGDMYVTSMGGRNVKAGNLVGSGVPFSEVRSVHMAGITLEGVAAIGVIGGALTRLTERGVVAPEEFPLCRFLHRVVTEDASLDVPWTTFFGGLR